MNQYAKYGLVLLAGAGIGAGILCNYKDKLFKAADNNISLVDETAQIDEDELAKMLADSKGMHCGDAVILAYDKDKKLTQPGELVRPLGTEFGKSEQGTIYLMGLNPDGSVINLKDRAFYSDVEILRDKRGGVKGTWAYHINAGGKDYLVFSSEVTNKVVDESNLEEKVVVASSKWDGRNYENNANVKSSKLESEVTSLGMQKPDAGVSMLVSHYSRKSWLKSCLEATGKAVAYPFKKAYEMCQPKQSNKLQSETKPVKVENNLQSDKTIKSVPDVAELDETANYIGNTRKIIAEVRDKVSDKDIEPLFKKMDEIQKAEGADAIDKAEELNVLAMELKYNVLKRELQKARQEASEQPSL